MENIRWILLLIGVLLVGGIYLFSRLQAREPRADAGRRGRLRRKQAPERRPEAFDPLAEADLGFAGHVVADENDEMATLPGSPATGTDNNLFMLLVAAPTRVPFRGPILLGALAQAKLEFGDMQIYHRTELVNGHEQTLFSVANIREPGTFDPDYMDEFTTEGLALFLQVTPDVEAGHAFDAMIESAQVLADCLDGHLLDASHSVLTRQTIRHLREEVVSCQLQQRVAKTAS